MAPAQGSPPTSTIEMHAPPAAQDYQHLVRSLQRRSAGRLAQDAARGGHDGATTVSHDLEADLRLAAEVGQALLRDKTALQQRLDAAEKANDKLLAKLSDGVKENARMQRRLEETVGSLEQADASNRALLVSLEEDRKTISRLSFDSGRLAAATATLTTLRRSHEDSVQEAASERKRADAAEAKCKKLEQRNVELDVRLKKANADLEELRQDKVLRTKRSVDTLAKLRARYAQDGSMTVSAPPAGEAVVEEEELSENTEAKELLKMVETLVTENNLLRSESMELHGLLQASRDEPVDHSSPPLTADPAFAEKLEDQLAKAQVEQATPTLPQYSSFSSASSSRPLPPPAADSIISPSISQALTDYDFGRRPSSPSSTNATSYFTRSHDPSASFSYSRGGAADMSRTLSGDSLESDALGPAFQQALTRKTSRKRPQPVTSASTGVLGHGRVPVGQRHSRRVLSMDVTASVRGELSSAPNSPRLDYSPSTRAPSIFSTTSEDPELSSRPRRHHRPLSLSLGPSIFPQVPEDDDQQQDPLISPFTRQPSHRRRPSQAPSLASDPGRLGISSSSRRPRASFSPERERPALVTVDSGTQTSPPSTPAQVPRVERSQASTPDRSSAFSRSPSPRGIPTRSHTSLSELSDERSYDPSSSSPRSGPASLHPSAAAAAATAAQVEQRTAALGQLIEHVAKLLARVQGADIATQEKRLMKQHLSGDVKHIAQANLRDLVTDIESVRHHFRRIVELERAAHVKSFQTLDSSRSASPFLSSSPSSAMPNPNDSLVTRRDFVLLVKLLRDLLLETTRLRSILNRVQLDPSLASSLRELDIPSALEPEMPAPPIGGASSSSGAAAAASAAAATAGGLLAPLSRLFGGAGGADEPSLARRASSAQLRPPPKRTGTVSTAAVNVEFGGGAVRHASASAAAGAAAGAGGEGGKGLLRPPSRPGQHRHVKREISSIFAGASSSSSSSRSATPATGTTEPWVVLPGSSTSSSPSAPIPAPAAAPAGPASRLTLASAASSYIPFGRLLSSYRPAMSSTTNAVLDPLPHAPPARAPRPPRADTALDSDSDTDDDDDDRPQETLLERQLRPRGLSDSSIRSSYLQHGARANPHHRLLTPAALALSAEPKLDSLGGVLSSSPSLSPSLAVGAATGGAALDALKTLGSVSRKPSTADLRKKPSSSRLRESAVVLPSEAEPAPPVPTLLSTSVVSSSSASSSSAVPIAISPPKDSPSPVGGGGPTGGAPGLFGTVVSSAFGSLSASVAAGEGGRKGERGEGAVRKGESSGRAG